MTAILRIVLTPLQHYLSVSALWTASVLYPGWWNHTTPYR